jgi:hypothetical protein
MELIALVPWFYQVGEIIICSTGMAEPLDGEIEDILPQFGGCPMDRRDFRIAHNSERIS